MIIVHSSHPETRILKKYFPNDEGLFRLKKLFSNDENLIHLAGNIWFQNL